jgi:Sugar-specific transcriptional regulator TrmB.
LDATREAFSQLDTELTQWLYAILNDAGLDLRAGGKTYVQDAYFGAENHSTTAGVVDLDITEVRHEQESVVYKHLADGMAPTDRDCLKTLVSDGGSVSPSDLSDETGRHRDTIYESLQRLEDLIEHTYNEVSLKSQYVAELVADALTQAQDSLSTAGKAVHAEDRGLDESTSAFVAWQEKYDIHHHDDVDAPLRVNLGRVESSREARRIIREGYSLWCQMNRDPAVFRAGTFQFEKDDSPDLQSVENQSPEWQGYIGPINRVLNRR